MLFFYNPECNACKEMKEAINTSLVIAVKIKSGDLQVLAIYTDNDQKAWLNHLEENR